RIVQRVLHHEDRRHGHGAVDQPLHRRGARGPAVSPAERAAWRHVPRVSPGGAIVMNLSLFALAYFAGAELGQALSVKAGDVVTIWPPGGLYLAALLCAPAIRWPWFVAAAAVGGLASDLFHGHSAWMGAGIWLATTAQALIGASLLRRLLSQPFRLHRLENAVGLAVVSGAIGAPCGALIAAPVLRVAFRTTFGEAWLTWSVAGLVGILVFTPLALVFQEHDWRASRPTPWRALEATLYVLATAAADVVVFGLLPAHRPMAFAVYPVLLWGVLRFGARGA